MGLTDEIRLYEDENGNGPAGLTEQRIRTIVKDPTFHVFTEEVSPTLTFVGEVKDQNASTSDPVWRIHRIFLIANETHKQYATNIEGNVGFDQIWDDRNAIFPAIPFSNIFSALLNGVDEYFDANGAAGLLDFGSADSFTLSAWSKTSFNSLFQVLFSKKISGGTGKGYEFNIEASTGHPFVLLVDTGSGSKFINVEANINITDGAWHNIVMTYDGTALASGVTIYVDGVDQAPLIVNTDNLGIGEFATGTEPFLIGIRGASILPFKGNLDENSAWDKVLSQAEITELYNLGTPKDLSLHSALVNLVSWWRTGEERVGVTIPDQQGNNNATAINMDDTNFVRDSPS